ncbi:hypothetical protein FA95DRAFT_1460850, partial [Auriscalpium vulgare]
SSPPPPHLHISMSGDAVAQFVKAYASDPALREKWAEADARNHPQFKGQCFVRGADDLLFFRVNDEPPRLCVPRSEVVPLLARVHDSPFEAAHEG